jgi:hypothetical protein
VTYRILADAVLILHLAYIAFALLGGLLILRWPKVAWLHLPAVAWGVTVAAIGGVCPLTPLEKHLRMLAGDVPYRGDFISHYLTTLIYPAGLTRPMQAALAIFLLAVNAAIYVRYFRRR